MCFDECFLKLLCQGACICGDSLHVIQSGVQSIAKMLMFKLVQKVDTKFDRLSIRVYGREGWRVHGINGDEMAGEMQRIKKGTSELEFVLFQPEKRDGKIYGLGGMLRGVEV